MCRSEPQMAVLVIFTMASRGFRISGSGTSTTCIWCFPYQQFAFMCAPALCPDKVVVFSRSAARSADWLTFSSGGFADFKELLESQQVGGDLMLGRSAQQLRNDRARFSSRRA